MQQSRSFSDKAYATSDAAYAVTVVFHTAAAAATATDD